MTVKEFYYAIGSSYDQAIGRLLSEERIKKFLGKFVEKDEFVPINNFFEAKSYEEAFRAVHSLKGMALNLELGPVAESSSALCEEVRHGKPDKDVNGMIADLKEKYYSTVELIKQIEE